MYLRHASKVRFRTACVISVRIVYNNRMDKFIENLKELRESRNMSQAALAEKLGISHTTVARWESGKISPTVKNLIAVCEYFKVSPNDLLDY